MALLKTMGGDKGSKGAMGVKERCGADGRRIRKLDDGFGSGIFGLDYGAGNGNKIINS